MARLSSPTDALLTPFEQVLVEALARALFKELVLDRAPTHAVGNSRSRATEQQTANTNEPPPAAGGRRQRAATVPKPAAAGLEAVAAERAR